MHDPQFGNWRRPVSTSTDETSFITDFQSGNYVATSPVGSEQWVLPTDNLAALAVRMLGTGNADTKAFVQISGWNGPTSEQGGRTPGQVLWQGQVLLGAQSSATSQPLPTWLSGTYREVDVFDDSLKSASAAGSNPSGAMVYAGGTGAMLLVPTLGYTRLILEMIIPGSGGVTTIGALARGIHGSELGELMVARESRGLLLTGVPGTAVVAAGPARAPLATAPARYDSVFVMAKKTNTVDVWIGDVTVEAAAGSEVGIPLAPGDGFTIPGPIDIANWYIDSTVAAEGVWWIAMIEKDRV